MYLKELNLTAALLTLLLILPQNLFGEFRRGDSYNKSNSYHSSLSSRDHNGKYSGNQNNKTGYRSYEDFIPGKNIRRKKYPEPEGNKKNATGKNKKNKETNIKRSNSDNRVLKRYRVKRGDTLYGISRKFGISVKKLTETNNIRRTNSIRIGMSLNIPVTPGKKEKYISKDNGKKSSNKPLRSPGFSWPIKKVIRCNRDGINGVKSIGIIIKGNAGSRVLSAASGVVKKIGEMRGYGKYVVVMHKNSFVTVYSKLGEVKVSEGKKVSAGDVIGVLDSNSVLHFQINQEGKSLNPLRYLSRKS